MKFMTLSMIIVGILMMFHMGGFDTPVSEGITYYLIDYLPNLIQSTWWSTLVHALELMAGVGVIVGLYKSTPQETYVFAGVGALLGAAILSDMIFIYVQLTSFDDSWMFWGITAIMGVLVLGWIISFMSWIRGAES